METAGLILILPWIRNKIYLAYVIAADCFYDWLERDPDKPRWKQAKHRLLVLLGTIILAIPVLAVWLGVAVFVIANYLAGLAERIINIRDSYRHKLQLQ